MTSATRNGPGEWARQIGPVARDAAGKIRRVVVSLTTRTLWQIAGHFFDDGTQETHDFEPFTGIGIYARPKATDRAEAIVVFIGGPNHGVIVATRNEDTRKAVGADLNEDETQIHNSQTVIRIKADGTVEIRLAGGVALPLATKADIDALAAYVDNQFGNLNGHVHATPSGPTTAITASTGGGTTAPTTLVPAAAGTQILKGQ